MASDIAVLFVARNVIVIAAVVVAVAVAAIAIVAAACKAKNLAHHRAN